MKKILLLIPRLERGGSESQISMLGRGLADRGYKVVIGALRRGGAIWDSLEGDPRIELLDLGHKTVFDYPLTFLRLRKWILLHKPDVVQSFLPVANVAAAVALCGLKIPPLFFGVRSLESNLKHHPPFTRVFWFLERVLQKRAAAIVFNSRFAMDFNASRGIGLERGRVIWNGLDLERLASVKDSGTLREQLGLSSDSFSIAHVARIDPRKDHSTLFKALILMQKQGITLPQVFCVGGGNSTLEAEYRSFIRENQLEKHVHLLGERSDALAIMQACDLCVLTSKEESFPNVVLEAMALGKPVLASSVGEIPALLDHGRGILFESGNAQQLADQILWCRDNRGTLRTLGDNSARFARESCSMRACIDQYQALYAIVSE